MSDLPPPSRRPAPASPSEAPGPVAIRRPRPKPATRAHPPVKRTMRDYWVMLCERWYWGLAPALVIGGVIAFQEFRAPPEFSSTAKLQLAPKRGEAAEFNLATFVEQMKSASFRDRVVQTFTPEEVAVIRRPYLLPGEDPVDASTLKDIVQHAVSITPASDTPIIRVDARHRDGAAAEIITNRFIRTFVEFNADAADTDLNSSLQRISDQERTQRQRLEEAEARLQEFREAHPEALTAGDRETLATRRVSALNEQLITARAQRVQLETTLQVINEARRRQEDLTRNPFIAGFRGVGDLLTELDRLQSDRALLERKYLENHPRMKANQLELDAKTALLRKSVNDAVAELQTKFAEARQQEERLIEDQKQASSEQSTVAQAGPAYRDLETRVANARELYASIEKQRNELLLARGGESVTVSILDRASPAQVATRDLRRPLIIGGAIALVLFFMVPIGFGLSDTRLKAAWEVEQFLKENLLGEMPAIDGVPRKERPHIMARDLDHGAAEAFRGLFGQLQLNSTVPYPKLLMLTSTLPGEGKSVVGNNLGATFAGHGKKTLLMDCDFRRPNLHVYYGKDNACGVMRWLENNDAPKLPALEDPDLGILPLQENFYLLRAGGESRRATELFEMEAFARLLVSLRSQFDIVLIDTPPIGVFPDSMLLSRMVDEIAYVCRFNAVNRSKIRKCIERLRTPNAVMAGIILNGIPSGKQSAHYDYYGYGANEAKRYKAYYAQRRT